jgi:hypothetical protein
LRAWAPASHALPVPTLAAVAALAAAPAVIVLARGGRDLGSSLIAACLIGAGAAGFAVDDPAGETIAASPTSLARRRLLRLSAIALGLAVVGGVLVAIAAAWGPLEADELARRAAEVAAASGLAAAVAGVGHRRAVIGAAQVGAVGGPLAVLVISSLAHRFHQLPELLSAHHHDRWWLVALAGWTAAAWTWRDPARR